MKICIEKSIFIHTHTHTHMKERAHSTPFCVFCVCVQMHACMWSHLHEFKRKTHVCVLYMCVQIHTCMWSYWHALTCNIRVCASARCRTVSITCSDTTMTVVQRPCVCLYTLRCIRACIILQHNNYLDNYYTQQTSHPKPSTPAVAPVVRASHMYAIFEHVHACFMYICMYIYIYAWQNLNTCYVYLHAEKISDWKPSYTSSWSTC